MSREPSGAVPHARPRTISVLVVDDEPEVAKLHAHVVESQPGFRLLAVVHTGYGALRAIEQQRPDLVLLDFGLPDIDGREVLRRLRASNRADIEVVALTAANDLESVRFARSSGVRHYLMKPFSVRVLAERLERIREDRLHLDAARGTLAQTEVDAILGGAESPSAVKPLPKGLGAETLERVRRVLHETPGAMSASEIALAAGMSRVTARRYLEFLLQLGEVLLEPRYGGAGRPEHRYALRP